jgi:hypothetical protein
MADSPEAVDTTQIDAGVAEIAEGLFDSAPQDDEDTSIDDATPPSEDAAPVSDDEPPPAEETTPPPAVTAKPPPQSWAKDKHEVWSKMDPAAQEYYEQREKQMLDGLEQYKENSGFGKQLKEVFTPYKALLQAQGVDEVKATQYMLNAHYRLSSGSPQEKAAYFAGLAQSYGIDLAGVQPAQQQQIDPNVKALQEKVGSLETALTQRQQQELTATQNKVKSEVEAFAADPKNVYFDECADDIALYVGAGSTLAEAYQKAVYANPVTRAKEISRLQAENEKALREKSAAEVAVARKASSTNVRGRDTRKAPTEPKGTMDDTLAATLKEIKERVH